MKGYAEVSCEKAMKARYNYINWLEQTEILVFDELIPRYYEQEYPKQNFILKWWHKNKSPKEFVCAKLECFGVYTDQLYKVTTDQEYKALYKWCWKDNRYSKIVRQLCSAATEGKILVDNALAGFIEEWYVE